MSWSNVTSTYGSRSYLQEGLPACLPQQDFLLDPEPLFLLRYPIRDFAQSLLPQVFRLDPEFRFRPSYQIRDFVDFEELIKD